MFERLKRLFRRSAPDLVELESVAEPLSDRPPQTPSRPARLPESPATASQGRADAALSSDEHSIHVTLRSVLLKLPETLKDKTRQPPSGGVRIAIPASKILSQLGQGSVRISFGELRKASPPGVFSDTPDRDHTLVDLPLQEILQQLKPDQLPRRMRQKRVEVPDEVVPIFSSNRGHSNVRIAKPAAPPTSGLKVGSTAPDSPSPIRLPETAPAPEKPSITMAAPSALRHAPTPATTQPPPIKPSIPLPPLGPAPAPVTAPRTATPIPASKSVATLRSDSNAAPAKPIAAEATPPVSSQPTAVATTPSTASGAVEFISVPLASVTTGWPEPIRHALAGLNAPDATLQLPAAETEQALRRGKVVFPWKRLKPLVKPPLKTALAPALDDVQLELPLPAIAPLFMAQRKPAASQRKYDVGEDIPDVFSNRGLAAFAPSAPTPSTAPAPTSTQAPAPPPSSPAPAPKAPAPIAATSIPSVSPPKAPLAPAAAPVSIPMLAQTQVAPPLREPALKAQPAPPVAPAPVADRVRMPVLTPTPALSVPAGAEPQDIGEVFGQPGRKNWSPAEIVQRTSTLSGVGGAVIAMQDGLLIAGQLPPGLNGEMIAAFLPQMYSRMMQYSKELKFGDSDHMTFIINHVPLRIYHAGTVYFAALGRAGEALPETALRLIAAHLGPQSK